MAARKAAAPAEQGESPQGAEAPNSRGGSCGEAEAELPATYFTGEMVKYLRRCPEQYMLSVLNSYVHLLFTGNVVDTADDHRYLDNFITLTRTVGLIDNDQPPTPAQAANFLFDNPALPLPRAERRRLQRMLRKQKRTIR